MELHFHGGAREVGRSCIELILSNGERYLFDVGIKFKENGLLLPENVEDIQRINGVFLSHAHLDHSGGLPLFEHKNLNCPIFCTKQTIKITKIMLKDSYKVARIKNMHPAYDNTDLKNVEKDIKEVKYDKWYTFKSLRFKFFNSSHIPGSAMILVEAENKKILYTGDFNNTKSNLLDELALSEDIKNIDYLITESTNARRDLLNRYEIEKKFLSSVEETIKNKGSVLIPTFSVGRAQELMLILSKKKWPVKIYTDGMLNKITRKVVTSYSQHVSNKDELKDFFNNGVEWISSPNRRKRVTKKQSIILTTSGMLQGGPVLQYVKELWHDKNNLITLVGFQCKRTNGRHLLDEGFLYIDGWKTYVKCKVEKFDFSGHTDKQGIIDMVLHTNPKKVFFQHGDPEAIEDMLSWAKKEFKGEAIGPNTNEKYSL